MSFVFYDTETTGINTSFDQILQFAAIKTDHELREVDRFEIRSRLLPHVVPSPGALLVTGNNVSRILDASLPSHYTMVRDIRKKLNEWSPAIFIGHNSLNFDEHMLRQALYQTLHPPYLTNTNRNCRSDSLRIIQAVSLFLPDVLSIPTDDKRQPTYKLDRLAPANGFAHSAAHDAMGDVEATLHMCRLVAERADGHWSNFIRFAQKAAVLAFGQEEAVFCLTDFFYGKAYSWMVTVVGQNPENGSEILVFDLSLDPEDLRGLNENELIERLTKRPRPIRSLRANACPILLTYDDAPAQLRATASDIEILRSRAKRISTDNEFSTRMIAAYLQTREQRSTSEHVEQQIYDSFTSDADYTVLTRFHDAQWRDRLALLKSVADGRIATLGQRLIYTEAPDVMTAEVRKNYDIALAKRLLAPGNSVPWTTLPKAIVETNDRLATAAPSHAALLRDLRDYLTQRTEQTAALLA